MKHLFLTSLFSLAVVLSAHAQEDYKDKDLIKHFENTEFYSVVDLPQNAKFKKKPKNIILLIGDGMGVAQVFSAITANKGTINMSQMPYVGFSQTQSADNYVTDSGAGGTALATGQRTYNGAIGVDVNKKSIPTILEISEQNGLATGLVSTSAITHATPASFISHVPDRNLYEDIAADFLKVEIDVFIGGGKDFFTQREDGRNLVDELKQKNYQVYNSLEESKGVESGLLAILTSEKHNDVYPNRGNMLPDATQKAIQVLQKNKKGFFLMVEGSMIDWGGHANNTEYIVQESLDFDRAVGKALEFAASNKETLVIVTADHETGGMAIEGGSMTEGKVNANFSTGGHTAIMVPVFAYGAGAYDFAGIYHNTDIFAKMKSLFGF